jgi:glutamyl-tRNA synthetase
MATFALIANPGKSSPTPYGPLAFAYSLPPAAGVTVNFVHSLPEGANAASVEIAG